MSTSCPKFLLPLALALLLFSAHFQQAFAQQAGGSQAGGAVACRYFSGAKSGGVQTFIPQTGFPGLPEGAACNDGMGNFGTVIPPAITLTSNAGNSPSGLNTSPGGSSGSLIGSALSFTCHYLTGPKAGSSQNFMGMAKSRLRPVGSPCSDSIANSGIMVADSYSSRFTATSSGNAINGQITDVVLNAR